MLTRQLYNNCWTCLIEEVLAAVVITASAPVRLRHRRMRRTAAA